MWVWDKEATKCHAVPRGHFDHSQASRAKGGSRVEMVKRVTAWKNPERGHLHRSWGPARAGAEDKHAHWAQFCLPLVCCQCSALAKPDRSQRPGLRGQGYALEGKELRGRAVGKPTQGLFTSHSPMLPCVFQNIPTSKCNPEETALAAKCLPCENEDLNSGPRSHISKSQTR